MTWPTEGQEVLEEISDDETHFGRFRVFPQELFMCLPGPRGRVRRVQGVLPPKVSFVFLTILNSKLSLD